MNSKEDIGVEQMDVNIGDETLGEKHGVERVEMNIGGHFRPNVEHIESQTFDGRLYTINEFTNAKNANSQIPEESTQMGAP